MPRLAPTGATRQTALEPQARPNLGLHFVTAWPVSIVSTDPVRIRADVRPEGITGEDKGSGGLLVADVAPMSQSLAWPTVGVVPAAPLPDALEVWLQAARPCVMATVRPDDAPVTVACWYEYQPGSRVLLCTLDTARRLDHLQKNPRVALTTLGDDWYQHVSLLGRVVETRPDEGLADLDRLSIHYKGIPYPDRVPV